MSPLNLLLLVLVAAARLRYLTIDRLVVCSHQLVGKSGALQESIPEDFKVGEVSSCLEEETADSECRLESAGLVLGLGDWMVREGSMLDCLVQDLLELLCCTLKLIHQAILHISDIVYRCFSDSIFTWS